MAGWAIGLGLLATPSFAQDAESAGQMQDVIEQQQTQIEAQQEQLKRLQQALAEQADLLRELQSQVISLASDEV